MKSQHQQIEFAIEVFVRGHSAGRSRTFPYEVRRVQSLWVMRDAPRRNPRDYRKEEWIAHGVDATEVDAIARRQTRGRFFVCAMIGKGEPDEPIRAAYKALGYRLLATEGFFLQRLKRVPKPPSPVPIERVRTPELAAGLAKVSRTRPIADELLGNDAPFRQYVALDGKEIVGRVRSVDAVGATWCADMYVSPSHRRRGIGQALLCRMLRDDRTRGSKSSVLTASHTGALLYPRVGYERIGTLFMFAPKRPKASQINASGWHGVVLSSAALQFPLGHPRVASIVAGATKPAEVRENVARMSAPIPRELWQELKHEGLLAEAAPVPA